MSLLFLKLGTAAFLSMLLVAQVAATRHIYSNGNAAFIDLISESMWNTSIMKVVRWIAFIPVCIMALGLIQILLGLGVAGLVKLHLSTFWLILILFLVGGMIMSLFGMLTTGISVLTVQFCPNYKVGGYILSVLTLASFTYMIIRLWTIQDNVRDVLGFCIVMTILYIGFCFSIIIISLSVGNNKLIENGN